MRLCGAEHQVCQVLVQHIRFRLTIVALGDVSVCVDHRRVLQRCGVVDDVGPSLRAVVQHRLGQFHAPLPGRGGVEDRAGFAEITAVDVDRGCCCGHVSQERDREGHPEELGVVLALREVRDAFEFRCRSRISTVGVVLDECSVGGVSEGAACQIDREHAVVAGQLTGFACGESAVEVAFSGGAAQCVCEVVARCGRVRVGQRQQPHQVLVDELGRVHSHVPCRSGPVAGDPNEGYSEGIAVLVVAYTEVESAGDAVACGF